MKTIVANKTAFNAQHVAHAAARRAARLDRPHAFAGCVDFDRNAARAEIRAAGFSAGNTALALRWLDMVCAVSLANSTVST